VIHRGVLVCGQVISSVLSYWAGDRPPLTLTAGCKVKGEYWGSAVEEKSMLVYKGELIHAVQV
jgi:hypothetical protein